MFNNIVALTILNFVCLLNCLTFLVTVAVVAAADGGGGGDDGGGDVFLSDIIDAALCCVPDEMLLSLTFNKTFRLFWLPATKTFLNTGQ